MDEYTFDYNKVYDGVEMIIDGLGLDINDPNLVDTPNRVASMLEEMCWGLYRPQMIEDILLTTFPAEYDEMIVVTDILATGICPHHLLPVRYRVHIGYVPMISRIKSGRVLGLSKIPRLVKLLCARPVLQEQLTSDIADTFESGLDPSGVMVLVIGEHDCVQCRGVRATESKMVTSAIRGVYTERERGAREEFLSIIESTR